MEEIQLLKSLCLPPSLSLPLSLPLFLPQEFIERDPEQAVTILQLLLHQRMLGGMLAPLFHPNACPAKFLEMYSSIAQVATKEGPNVAFSVLSKVPMMSAVFNLVYCHHFWCYTCISPFFSYSSSSSSSLLSSTSFTTIITSCYS